MKKITDVDIDCANRDKILEGLKFISARIDRKNDTFEKHKTGVYFQEIPYDPFINMSTVDFKVAGELGYFKIDLLNVSIYEKVKDEQHLEKLLNQEPVWECFEYEEITDKLFQLNGKSSLLKKFKPQSVEDLAVLLAIIRPAKAYLQKKDWSTIKREVWKKESDSSYQYRKSHGIAYALAVVVHLNLLMEEMNN